MIVARLLAIAAAAIVCGCSSSSTSGGAGSGSGSPSTASGGDAAAAPDPIVSNTTGATYTVPSPAELASAATFPLAAVEWKIVGGVARLSYDLPAELVGTPTRVLLTGTQDAATGNFNLTGPNGTGVCPPPDAQNRMACTEHLTGIAVDMAAVRLALSARPQAAQDLGVQVAQRFSTDPIGIVSFGPSAQELPEPGSGKNKP